MQNPALNIYLGHLMVLVLLFAKPAALADEANPLQSAAPQTTVSEVDLEAFAKAYVEYHRIRRIYEARISKAENAKEKDKIQNEGNAKVGQALKKQGLTAQSYNRLFTAVNSNESLRQKALKFIANELNNS